MPGEAGKATAPALASKEGIGWAWVVAGVMAILATAAGVIYTMTRGLRNNNPGNLKKDETAWAGLAPAQSDPVFFVFTAPVYGLRAMARVLMNYQAQHGLHVISELIARWAPASENDTSEYAQNVAAALGLDPSESVDLLNNADQLKAFMAAITRQENGVNPYPDSLYDEAVRLALA